MWRRGLLSPAERKSSSASKLEFSGRWTDPCPQQQKGRKRYLIGVKSLLLDVWGLFWDKSPLSELSRARAAADSGHHIPRWGLTPSAGGWVNFAFVPLAAAPGLVLLELKIPHPRGWDAAGHGSASRVSDPHPSRVGAVPGASPRAEGMMLSPAAFLRSLLW